RGPAARAAPSVAERLVDAFAAAGRRVATVKSIHHAIEPDEPGTDTHRHRTAGAAATVGITPRHAFEVRPHDRGESGDEGESGDGGADARKRAALRDALDRFAAAGYDLVVVEGFAEVAVPTVLVGNADPERVAGEVVADGDEPFDAVREAVRAVGPPESLGRAQAAEPTATDTDHR
ncbi:molybdopterin-guanine dinucleotide biosynthesis protein MobB, partial [Halorubrum sp. SS7]|uniref:molybdopterin-guanine dinucleotide biosynthesis protein B n=1 Tax=Halorubrum sp. SS7 TaxID=2518119 RepID=UPI0010F501CA